MQKNILGQSVKGQDIVEYRLGDVKQLKSKFLLIGGVHGDEKEGFFLVEEFMKSELSKVSSGIVLSVIPRLNVDGCQDDKRQNSNGVDLNRNMATQDWTSEVLKPKYFPGEKANSEIETQLLEKYILEFKPDAILSAHSWKPMINVNGPALAWGKHMSSFSGVIVTESVGYPTPGSLGTWAGLERQIPTITLEIERDSSEQDILKTHLKALLESINYTATAAFHEQVKREKKESK